jgi:hypothetical protein
MVLYARRKPLALLLVNIFKGKINWYSVIETVGLHVPTKPIKNLSIFNVSKFQDLVLHQGASQLQTASETFWTFF